MAHLGYGLVPTFGHVDFDYDSDGCPTITREVEFHPMFAVHASLPIGRIQHSHYHHGEIDVSPSNLMRRVALIASGDTSTDDSDSNPHARKTSKEKKRELVMDLENVISEITKYKRMLDDKKKESKSFSTDTDEFHLKKGKEDLLQKENELMVIMSTINIRESNYNSLAKANSSLSMYHSSAMTKDQIKAILLGYKSECHGEAEMCMDSILMAIDTADISHLITKLNEILINYDQMTKSIKNRSDYLKSEICILKERGDELKTIIRDKKSHEKKVKEACDNYESKIRDLERRKKEIESKLYQI